MDIKSEKSGIMLFFFQVLLIFVVVCVSLMNLSLQWGNHDLWTVILTSSLGYIMPNPKFKSTVSQKELNSKSSSSQELGH